MKSKQKTSRTGSALVIVLGLLSVLLLMGIAFSITMRTERGGASNMRHAAMARHALDTALAHVMSDIDTALNYEEELDGDDDDEERVGYLTNMVVLVSGQDDDGDGWSNILEIKAVKNGGREYSKVMYDDLHPDADDYPKDVDTNSCVKVLSHSAAKHLSSDQLLAALTLTNICMSSIRSDIRICDNNSNPTAKDSVVGRYAYVVLNENGYLDPNAVGRDDRLLGRSTREIQIAKPNVRKGKDVILEQDRNGLASGFYAQRKKDGHYATMRDFLRDDVIDFIDDEPIQVNGRNGQTSFSTNCFSIGSMALDDLTPPVEVQNSGIDKFNSKHRARYRRAKCALVDVDPEDVDASKLADIALAFQESFRNAQDMDKGDLPLPHNYEYGDGRTKSISMPFLATRNLMDAIDHGAMPGKSGDEGYNLDGSDSRENLLDSYLKKMGKNVFWDQLPCVEPLPLLDNIVIVAGTETKPAISIKRNRMKYEDGSWGPTTNATCTLTLGLACNSAYFSAWNFPDGLKEEYADKTEYSYGWIFSGISHIEATGGKNGYKELFEDALSQLDADMEHQPVCSFKFSGPANCVFRQEADTGFVQDIGSVEFTLPLPSGVAGEMANDEDFFKSLPSKIVCNIYATGYIVKGSKDDAKELRNVYQVVPAAAECLQKGDEPKHGVESIEIPLVFEMSKLVRNDGGTLVGNQIDGGTDGFDFDYVVGGASCLDPAYGCRVDMWLPFNDVQETFLKGRNFHSLDDYDWSRDGGADLSPMARMYLEKPYDVLNSGYFQDIPGGVSDAMWACDGDEPDDPAEEAAYAFFFDPEEDDDGSPFRFNRVGQLGFLPIGIYRTIALLDGYSTEGKRVPRHRVLDYFTMVQPLEEGTEGSSGRPGNRAKSARFTSRLNINPPHNMAWKQGVLIMDGYNLLPMAAALLDCPQREWMDEAKDKAKRYSAGRKRIDWNTATNLVASYVKNIKRDDDYVRAEASIKDDWYDARNSRGIAHDLSVLGRCAGEDEGWDTILSDKDAKEDTHENDFDPTARAVCDFDREGVIRNSSELFTARQQCFTVLIMADAFSPQVGYRDASHGTVLASLSAVAHIWRDPEPLRDKAGIPIRDKNGNPVHSFVVLDLYQF